MEINWHTSMLILYHVLQTGCCHSFPTSKVLLTRYVTCPTLGRCLIISFVIQTLCCYRATSFTIIKPDWRNCQIFDPFTLGKYHPINRLHKQESANRKT